MKLPVHISSDKHRIALVLTELRAGGMEKVVVHLAKGLARRNLEVLVVCLQTAGQLASELDDDKKRAAKIVVAPLSYPVTVVMVQVLECDGCYIVNLQRNDNQEMSEVNLKDWMVVQ